MNAYEQKQEARRYRLLSRAAALEAQAESANKRSNDLVACIPFGQPILVGHHSEGRHRRTLEKSWNLMGKFVALSAQAKETARRADAVGSAGVSSDDPEAPDKLRAQLAKLEAQRSHMVKVNKLFRAGKAPELAVLGYDLEKLRVQVAAQYSWERAPFVGWELSNLGANIRRIKARIEELDRKAPMMEADSVEHDEGAFVVVENFEANRIQLKFAGKPAAAVRDVLKRSGFRWAPSEGAWQRQLKDGIVASVRGGYLGQQIRDAIAKGQA
jgi:hypothetical protein